MCAIYSLKNKYTTLHIDPTLQGVPFIYLALDYGSGNDLWSKVSYHQLIYREKITTDNVEISDYVWLKDLRGMVKKYVLSFQMVSKASIDHLALNKGSGNDSQSKVGNFTLGEGEKNYETTLSLYLLFSPLTSALSKRDFKHYRDYGFDISADVWEKYCSSQEDCSFSGPLWLPSHSSRAMGVAKSRKCIALYCLMNVKSGNSLNEILHDAPTFASLMQHIQKSSGIDHLALNDGSGNDSQCKSDIICPCHNGHPRTTVLIFLANSIENPDHPINQDTILHIYSGIFNLLGDSLLPNSITNRCMEDSKVLQHIQLVPRGLLTFQSYCLPSFLKRNGSCKKNIRNSLSGRVLYFCSRSSVASCMKQSGHVPSLETNIKDKHPSEAVRPPPFYMEKKKCVPYTGIPTMKHVIMRWPSLSLSLHDMITYKKLLGIEHPSEAVRPHHFTWRRRNVCHIQCILILGENGGMVVRGLQLSNFTNLIFVLNPDDFINQDNILDIS
ncbi:hypothetical protein OSB04_027382 [Centaurea solstitialis]|uniref:Uncharacterized protein n=1 Tax=Centaurea solstitialis TaxID=347529 RepID=A0AA38WA72_9ASTR|nr:hypothetical protein OSB04_027382 [Centaurea solstitialis]